MGAGTGRCGTPRRRAAALLHLTRGIARTFGPPALATWQQLGMVVETAFAQLGLGRTLLGLDRMDEAVGGIAAFVATDPVASNSG
jgi:hypothetical protein